MVRIYGDEFFAYQETEDGYLVTRDPRSGFFCYAKLTPDGRDLISTGVRIGKRPPAGLKPKARLAPGAAIAKGKKLRELLYRTEDGRIDHERLKQLDIETRKKAGKPLPPAEAAPTPSSETEEDASIQYSPSPNGESGTYHAPAPGDETTTAPAPAPQYAPAATIDTRTGLVLLASFPDRPQDINKTREQIDAYCNAPSYTADGNATSIYEYFLIQSNGRLVYKNIVTAWYTAANNRAYYTDETQGPTVRAKELMIEGLEILKADGFDFTKCDENSDNKIDGVSVFYAGAAVNNWSKGLWPHMGGASWSGFADSGMTTSFTYQFSDMPASLGTFTFCHESGHMILNYPDLYQYDGNAAQMNYCLMGSNTPLHPRSISSYLKIMSGWAEVIDLDSSSHRRCVLQEDLNLFYRYKNPSNTSEYFLFEMRGNNGYEGPYGGAAATNPTYGIAAYHALETGDNTRSSIRTEESPSCDYSKPYELMLIEAYNSNNGTTPWYDNPLLQSNDGFGSVVKEISDSTSPALKFWDSSGRTVTSGAHVHSISDPGETMSFIIGTGSLSNDPEIGITIGSMAWVVDQGNNAPAQSFSIFNAGTGSISYSITDDMNWLSVSPTSGTVNDSTNLVDTINVTFSTSGLVPGSYSGTITVTASGIANSPVEIPVTLEVNTALVAPSITLQPASATIEAGSSHDLTASATGNPAVGYQWYKDGVEISGGNDGSLNFANASVSDSGDYYAVISNLAGSVTTNTVTLTVNPVNEAPVVDWISPLANYIGAPSGVGLWLESDVTDDGFGGGSLTITWSTVSGPGGGVVTWDNTNTDTTTAFFSKDGDYQLRMVASDGSLSTQKDFYVAVGTAADGTVSATDQIIHYHFDETSGSTANNQMPAVGGVDHDGTLYGNTSFQNGVIDFDGNLDYITIQPSTSFDMWGSQFAKRTVSMWFKADTVTGRQCLFEEGGGAYGLNLYLDGSTLYGRGWNSGNNGWNSTTLSVGGIGTGEWHHATIVLDATNGSTTLESNVFHLYLDGALVATGDGAPLYGATNGSHIGGNYSATSFHDGNATGTAYFNGQADDFRVYNRALTSSEVQILARLHGPSINAGADVSGNAGTNVALDGTLTANRLPDWATTSTLWYQQSGPGTVTFGNTSNIDTTANASTDGSYVLRLTADTGQVRTVDGCTMTASYVNYAPTWTSTPVNEADASKNVSYSSTLADNATDTNDDTLTFAKVSGPSWLAVASNGALSGTPSTSDVGSNVFTVSVSDSIASPVEATLNITVLNTNVAPVFGSDPISGSNATEDSAYSGTIAGSATDADDDTLSYSKNSGPSWLSIASNGTLSGTPTNSDVGSNSFTVIVSDGNGGSDTTTLNITVINTNDAPVFSSDPIDGGSAPTETTYTGTLSGSATDDDNDTLVYAKVSGPTWLSVASNGTLSGTPSSSDVGANAFTVSVTDGIIASPVQATLNITVNVYSGPSTVNSASFAAAAGNTAISTTGTLGWGYFSYDDVLNNGIFDSNLGGSGASYNNTPFGSITRNGDGATLTTVGGSYTGVTLTEGAGGTDTLSAKGAASAYTFDGNTAHGNFGSLGGNEQNAYTITFNDLGIGTYDITIYMDHDNSGRVFDMDHNLAGETGTTTMSSSIGTLNGGSGTAFTYNIRITVTAATDDLSLTFGSISGGSGTGWLAGYSVTAVGGDTTPPSLASTDIVDDQSGANVDIDTLVTYTVTFNEDMDASTVTAADFGNAGTASVNIGTVSKSSAGEFTVPVTPTTSGTLKLQVSASATLTDVAGNQLDTTSAISDDTTITVLTEYQTWTGGTETTFSADTNGDGIGDGLAWLLGATNGSNAQSNLPSGTPESGGGLTIQFSMLNSSSRGDANISLQYSNDMGVTDAWANNQVLIPDSSSTVNGVIFVITANGNMNQVEATIPGSAASANGKLFSRLAAQETNN